jgi:hypothetical protein
MGFINWKIKDGQTAHNRIVYASPLKRLGLRKTAVGLRPLCGFFSATFGAGGVAPQRPITCPKRRIQLLRYMQFALKYFRNNLSMY